MAEKGVKLFSMWVSAFGLRVEWALRLKGIEYQYIAEDLPNNKSADLLRLNPVTKKVPVLVHDGRTLAESLVIIEYIDETWSHGHPLLPKDPYDRAQARFWAKFVDDKIVPGYYAVCCKTGEAMQKGVGEVQEALWALEGALTGKKFFGGGRVGFLDLAAGWMALRLRMLEDIAGVTIVSEESHPLINEWFDSFLGEEIVKERLPPKDELYAFCRARREQFLSGELVYKQ